MDKNFWWGAQLVIPQTFQQCLSYEKQVLWLYKHISDLETKVSELEATIAELQEKIAQLEGQQ